jgi:hypothetical protein
MCVGILILLVSATPKSWADDSAPAQTDPPARLQKRPRPNEKPESRPKENAEAKKADKQTPSKEAPHTEPEEPVPQEEVRRRLEDVMGRVAKNLREAESRLAKSDTGEGTQQIQRDIAKDFEDLLEHLKQEAKAQQAKDCASSSGGPQAGEARGRRAAQSNEASRQEASRRPGQVQQTNQNALGQSAARKEEMSKIADLYKDTWGHLPETLRQEMDQYSRERFMDKYSELLKQYYKTIAEKSSRKRD